jgi:hypothetical protein
MIKVTEKDHYLTIEWDPDDPVERIFNYWSEEDFKKMITDACVKILENSKEEDDPLAK